MAYKRRRYRVRRLRAFGRRTRRTRRSYKRYRKGDRITRRKLNLIPADQAYVKFRTNYYTPLTTTGTKIAEYVTLKANSFLDPFGTGSIDPVVNGIGEYYYDYDKYYIGGCKVRVQVINRQTNAPSYAFILPGTQVLGLVGGQDEKIISQPYCVSKLMAPLGQNTASTTYLKNYISTQKIFGSKHVKFGDNYRGTLGQDTQNGSGPPIPWFMYIGICTPDGSNLPTATNALLNINVNWYAQLYQKSLLYK